MKAQLEAYESHRAMFEAYTKNKYNSTGLIQWMLNSAWPSNMWHLYDYYYQVSSVLFDSYSSQASVDNMFCAVFVSTGPHPPPLRVF